MSVTAGLRNEFPSTVRQRGENYVRQGRVRIRSGSDTRVEGVVRGSSDYGVEIVWQDDALSFWCDCAHFASEGPCKHLWATLLVAEARGYLTAPKTAKLNDYPPMPELPGASPAPPPPAPSPPAPKWKRQVDEILQQHSRPVRPAGWSAQREILYLVDVDSSKMANAVVVRLARRDRRKDGSWTASSPLTLKRYQIQDLPDSADREILSAVAGSRQFYGWNDLDGYDPVPEWTKLDSAFAGMILPMVLKTERCFRQRREMRDLPADAQPLAWDDGPPWQFALEMRRGDQGWIVNGLFRRGEERMELSAPLLVTSGGMLFTERTVARLAPDAPFEWMMHLRRDGAITAPPEDGEKLLETLLCAPGLPSLDVPDELRYQEVRGTARPFLRIHGRTGGRLRAELSFDYGGRTAAAHEKTGGFYDSEGRRFLRRDLQAESAAAKQLGDLGMKQLPATPSEPVPSWELAPAKFPEAVRALVQTGWHVEADGKVFRRPGVPAGRLERCGLVRTARRSGVWRDYRRKLPALAGSAAARREHGAAGRRHLRHAARRNGCGRFGIAGGHGRRRRTDHMRFRRSQAGLLDALLAAQPEVDCDETFERVREELRSFRRR